MASHSKPVKGRAYKFYVGLYSQADTKLLISAPTLDAADFRISKDGGALAPLTTLPSVYPAGSAAVMIDLSAAEMNADNISIICADAAGAQWCSQMIAIEPIEAAIPNFHFVMRDTSGNPATGRTVTVTRVLDNGTFGAGTVGTITEIGSGLYRVNLPKEDLLAVDCVSLLATATGCMPTMVTLTGR
jgi:hypothetical protein